MLTRSPETFRISLSKTESTGAKNGLQGEVSFVSGYWLWQQWETPILSKQDTLYNIIICPWLPIPPPWPVMSLYTTRGLLPSHLRTCLTCYKVTIDISRLRQPDGLLRLGCYQDGDLDLITPAPLPLLPPLLASRAEQTDRQSIAKARQGYNSTTWHTLLSSPLLYSTRSLYNEAANVCR